MEAIETLDLTILAHVPYGADVVPSSFHLFPKTRKNFMVMCVIPLKGWKGLSGPG